MSISFRKVVVSAFAAAVVAGVGLFASGAFGATSITDVRLIANETGTASKARIAFSGRPANDEFLAVGYAAADCGDDPSDWTLFEKFGAVSNDTVQVELPAGWGTDYLALRVFLVGPRTESYGTPVEYVETDGAVCLDSGISLQLGDEYEAKVRTAPVMSKGNFFLGAYGSDLSTTRMTVFQAVPQTGWLLGYNDQLVQWTGAATTGTDFYLRTTFDKGAQVLYGGTSEDDVVERARSASTADPATDAHLYVFARNANGGTPDAFAEFGSRIYSMKATNGGTLRLNLVPCLIEGQASLYDTVTGLALQQVKSSGSLTAGRPFPDYDNAVAVSEPVSAGQQALSATVTDVTQAGDKLTVAVSLSGVRVAADMLRIAVADVDCGADIGAWPTVADCGTIESDESVQSFEIDCPAGLTGGFVRAFVTDAFEPLPVDVVEYLEVSKASGAQINLEHVLSVGETYDVKMRTGTSASAANWFLVGAYKGASAGANMRSTVIQYDGQWDIGLNELWGMASGQGRLSNPCANQTVYYLKSVFSNGAQDMYAGPEPNPTTRVQWSKASGPASNTDIPLYVFARNCNGTSVDNPAPVGTRLYSLKVSDASGVVIKDYLPCKKNDAIGLYERMNGTFCEGAASALKTGADVPQLPEALFAGESFAWGRYRRDITSVVVLQDDNGNDVALRVGVTENGSYSNQVFVAYASEDCGTDALDWEKVVVAGWVRGDQTTVDVPLESGWGSAYGACRVFLGVASDRPVLPNEVEYIETDGKSYVDIGHFLAFGETYEMKIRTSATVQPGTDAWMFLGSTDGSNRSYVFDYSYNPGQHQEGWEFGFNAVIEHCDVKVQSDTEYFLCAEIGNGSQNLFVGGSAKDMSCVLTTSAAGSIANTTAPLHLFCRNRQNGTFDQVCPSGTRLYSLVISNATGVVRNYVPCARNGVGYLYETVESREWPNVSKTAGATLAGGPAVTGAFSSVSDAVTPSPPRAIESLELLKDASGLETTLRVVVAENGSHSNQLCVAYASTDKGTDVTLWDKIVIVGWIPGDQTTVDVPLDAAWGGQYGVCRAFFGLASGGGETTVPNEVEYIETDGKSYVDIGHFLAFGETYEMKIRTSATVQPGTDAWMFLGSTDGSNRSYVFDYSCDLVLHQEGWEFGFNAVIQHCDVKVQSDTEYFLRAEIGNGSQNLFVGGSAEDMSCVLTTSAAGSIANTTAPLHLFCRNKQNKTFDQVCPSGTRLYSLVISNAFGVVRNYVPCARNGVGYLYETVGGNEYPNASTASGAILSAGPAKGVRVESVTFVSEAAVTSAPRVKEISLLPVEEYGEFAFSVALAVGADATADISLVWGTPESPLANTNLVKTGVAAGTYVVRLPEGDLPADGMVVVSAFATSGSYVSGLITMTGLPVSTTPTGSVLDTKMFGSSQEPDSARKGLFYSNRKSIPAEGVRQTAVLVNGRLKTVGSGETKLWANWGDATDALTKWTPIESCAATGADGYSFTGLLPVRGPKDIYCRLVSSNTVMRAEGPVSFGSATDVYLLEQVGGTQQGLILFVH